MALINLSNIKKYYGNDLILNNISLNIENNHKIGFVGANGSGKTTLFKIIANQISKDDGEIFISKSAEIAYVDQFIVSNENTNVFDETLTVFKELKNIENELEIINQKLLNDS